MERWVIELWLEAVIGARPSYDHGDLVQLQFHAQSEVTDAALDQLRELTDLHTLHLSHTNITDAKLEHLEGLTNLRKLRLDGTQVTEEGVMKLQRALPNCNIRR